MTNKDVTRISAYKDWLQSLKGRIQQSQIKAAIQVNSELLRLYWQMGSEIVEKQMDTAWGTGFFDTLSKDLKEEFPSMKGFSVTNLRYIKQWYLFYCKEETIYQQVVGELAEAFFSIPWGHHIIIIQR